MKIETAIARITQSDAPDHMKALRLDTLALRCMAASPNQKLVKAASDAIKARCGGHGVVYAKMWAGLK